MFPDAASMKGFVFKDTGAYYMADKNVNGDLVVEVPLRTDPTAKWDFTNNVWVADTAVQFATAVKAKVQEIEAASASAFKGGFVSGALGGSYQYPTATLMDEMNLQNAVQEALTNSSSSPSIMCQNLVDNTWGFTPHTAAQTLTVGSDYRSFISTTRERRQNLLNQVQAVTQTGDFVTALAAITW